MDTKFSIALHILVYIEETDKVVTSELLAQSVGTNASHIRKIITLLKDANIIESQQGKKGMSLKVKADEETRSQIVQIANIYRGNILDVSPKSLVIELTGDIEKLRGFIGMMNNYGILEMAKTGIVAMSRGEKM